MRRFRVLACLIPGLLVGVSLCDFAAAQERVITVQNLSPFARREWVGAVVPFKQGEIAKLPEMHVGKGPTIWQPIGARWNDGSLRQALCMFPVQMKRLSEVSLPLEKGKGQDLEDIPIIDPVVAKSARVEMRVVIGGKTVVGTPKFVRELEVNKARRVSLHRCRVGETGLVFELIVNAYAGQAHCYADIALFFSDPTTKAMQVSIDEAVVATAGMHFVFRHDGPLAMDTKILESGTEVTLLKDVILGDSQGIRRAGVLAPKLDGRGQLRDQTLQAAALGPILAATTWRGTGAYGPFGVVPDAPPWLRGDRGRAALARRHADVVRRSKIRGEPFQRFRFMLDKYPGATGSQPDFGILKMTPVASTGMPSFLLEVEPSILQEACRPVHYFESDGSPLQSKNHPDWVALSGRTHYHCGVSKDRLGKPCPPPRYDSNGWKGKDRQHWSSNYLCGYYLLTGHHWALREIENEVQLFLGTQTLRAGISTSGPGSPRAVGRMLTLGCWLYQCTGDKSLLERMHTRMEGAYLRGWAGRELPKDKVRPLAIRPARAGTLGGKVVFWTPWEEGIAVIGYAAFHRLTGSATAWMLAEEISLNTLRHGWLVTDGGVNVGYELRYNKDGSPLTREQQLAREKDVCVWSGGGISLWAMPAVQVALHFAKKRGDKAMTEKAERILSVMRSGRDRAPRDGWWDEFRDWDAIRIDG